MCPELPRSGEALDGPCRPCDGFVSSCPRGWMRAAAAWESPEADDAQVGGLGYGYR